jgi:hypothetical protein
MVVNGVNSSLVSGTAVASTSGTSIDFTSIPSWVKRITVMFNGVSTNGTSVVQIQVGSGSFSTSGYFSVSNYSGSALTTSTTGIVIEVSGSATAACKRYGAIVLTLVNSNTWVEQGNIASDTNTISQSCSGFAPALAGALDRVRITTVGGTDTFDAGSINILYE